MLELGDCDVLIGNVVDKVVFSDSIPLKESYN